MGQGETLSQILDSTRMVAEGVKNALSFHLLAQRLGVDMPLVEAVYRILYEGSVPKGRGQETHDPGTQGRTGGHRRKPGSEAFLTLSTGSPVRRGFGYADGERGRAYFNLTQRERMIWAEAR